MPQRQYNIPDAENINFRVKYHNEPALLPDVCLFSSFSFAGVVEEYVYYYLQELKKAGFAIVFISTSQLEESCVSRLSQYSFMIIERDNRCPDFGSWKAGLSMLDWGKQLNSVLLVNDSVFGPFFNIASIISSMKERFDVWGMTESNEIDLHIQSYFIYFNKAAAASSIFSNFWKQVDLMATKDEVIQRYEIGLSALFRSNNFTLGAYAGIDNLTQNTYQEHRVTNPTLVFWKALIQNHQFPFLKRELLIKMNISKTYWGVNLYVNTSGWKKTIEQFTDYPVSYIEQFLHNYYRVLGPARNMVLQKRKILFLTHNAEDSEGQRLLITFLQWLKRESGIKAEIIICNPGKNELDNEFASLGVVTYFYELSNIAKRNLKERLIDEVALIFSNTIENIAIQKFFSYTFIPQVIFVHEPVEALKNFLSADNASWLKKNISHFITSSGTGKQTILNELAVDDKKADRVYKFVDFYTPENTERKQREIKALLGLPADAFVVGMCGDAAKEKPAELLPLIAAILCRADNTIHIVWLDDSASRSKNEQIHFDLLRTGLISRVHFIKKEGDNRHCFGAFDVFVLAAREENFPLINLEAGLAGKPVICFDNAAYADGYADFGIAQAVPYLDIQLLAEKVLEYFHNRQQLADEQERLPRIISQHFTTEIQAPKILQLIRNYYDDTELMLKEEPALTFFTHIYYENTWDEIRNKLKNFDNGKNHFLFSVSEACLIKDDIVEDIKKSFEKSYVLITSNIGKDIGGKMALIDLYLLLNINSSFLVFLHDKQSPHSIIGETWKAGLFKIIDPNYQKMIVSLFANPAIGIIGDKDHIVNEYDPVTKTFRNNSQLSKKLLQKFDMSIDNYDFLGGSMYWIRSSIIRKFFKENNPILMRENLEAGNVLDLYEERMAHTWERMFSWIATNQGYTIKGI